VPDSDPTFATFEVIRGEVNSAIRRSWTNGDEEQVVVSNWVADEIERLTQECDHIHDALQSCLMRNTEAMATLQDRNDEIERLRVIVYKHAGLILDESIAHGCDGSHAE
jgi:hypothetical protein